MAVTIMATMIMMEVVELLLLLLLLLLWNILGVEILFMNELNLKVNYKILKKNIEKYC
jgi:hypothetical protein